ncbi:hypothetical protein uan_059 [Pseudomonas phage UAntarctica]|nr:hypothetical protein uan_059 [Pseudomonas phage UAntarctica]
MNTMLSSLTEVETRVRSYIRSKVTPEMLYAFDFVEGLDLSDNDAGVLLEQDKDFWMMEITIERTGRAGPSRVSPRRVQATLDIAIFTKAPRDKVKFNTLLEGVANWFQDETVDGMRFRTYLPTSTVPMHGFTSYNGVINFDFEIALSRS